MPVYPISTIIETAKIRSVESLLEIIRSNFYAKNPPDKRLPLLLYIERKSVEWLYTLDPTNSTLDGTANYLFALCGGQPVLAQTIPLIIIVQPVSQSVNSGTNVVFSVAAGGGTTPYEYQWRFNGVSISGEEASTLTINNVDGSDQGDYDVVITDSSNPEQQVISNTVSLTVNVIGISVFASAQVVDPWTDIGSGNDPFSYSYTQSITSGANISWPLLNADNNKFFIFKEPVSQPVKTAYFNTVLNSGAIPDSVFRGPVVIGSFRYIVTRLSYAYDLGVPTILSS